MQALLSSRMLGITHPATYHFHFPEDSNLPQYCSEKLKCCTVRVLMVNVYKSHKTLYFIITFYEQEHNTALIMLISSKIIVNCSATHLLVTVRIF
jgi:hypothetical protein